MIYLVGGFMRSGTSMMMKCLHAGGLDVVYSEKRDEENARKWADDQYHPNPGGFYEPDRTQLRRRKELIQSAEGKLIKALRRSPLRLPDTHRYRMVVMRRDPEEIRQSAQAIFSDNMPPDYGVKANAMIDTMLNDLRQKMNFAVSEIAYRSVLAQPKVVFECLAAAGWPIDPDRAAAEVNTSLCRFKREDLDIGV